MWRASPLLSEVGPYPEGSGEPLKDSKQDLI